MSYDLFFKPRTGEITAEAFEAYFNGRPHYKMDGSQAWYENKDTRAYFVFEFQGDDGEDDIESFPVALNINFFRPSFFGLEAEPEVAAFVRAFDMTVSDPQTDGMGDGEYNSELFLSGWNHGNEFGYQAILKDPVNRQQVTLPSATILDAWSWNRRRNELQDELGDTKFVPLIMFLDIEGQLTTAAVWPEGIPIAVPDVEYFLIPRRELAPKRFFKRVEDQTIASRHELLPVFTQHGAARSDGTIVLDYVHAPKEIRKFVESLSRDERKISGVPADSVLDRELFERYAK